MKHLINQYLELPYVDRYGHEYSSPEEVKGAVKFLSDDAAFLESELARYQEKNDGFMIDAVSKNAQHSRDYAAELKSVID